MTDIPCRDVQDEISNYLDGDLSADTRWALESHLAGCSTCRVLLDSMSKTLRILTDCGCVELPVEEHSPLVERIMARVRQRDTKS